MEMTLTDDLVSGLQNDNFRCFNRVKELKLLPLFTKFFSVTEDLITDHKGPFGTSSGLDSVGQSVKPVQAFAILHNSATIVNAFAWLCHSCLLYKSVTVAELSRAKPL